MRYGTLLCLLLLSFLSVHSQENLPDELELIQSVTIETNLPALEAQTTFSLDGRIAASRTGENNVYIWDVVTGEMLLSLGGDSQGVYNITAIALNADGSNIAIAIRERISVFELAALENLSNSGLEEDINLASRFYLQDNDPSLRIQWLAFSPDNSRLFALSASQSFIVWDVSEELANETNNQETWFLPLAQIDSFQNPAIRLADSSPIMLTNDALYFIAAAPIPSNRRTLRDYFFVHMPYNFSPDGLSLSNPFKRDALEYVQISDDAQWILAFSLSEDTFVIQSIETGEIRQIIPDTIETRYLAATRAVMNPDASILAVVEDSGLRLFNIQTGEELARTEADASEFLDIYFISERLIALAYPNRVLIYDWIDGD